MSEPQLKASVIIVTRDLFRQPENAAREKEFLRLLSPEEETIYQKSLATSWIPVRVAGQLLEKSARLLFPLQPNPIRELGRIEAHQQITALQKTLLSMSSMSMITRQIQAVFSSYYDQGRIYIDLPDKKTARVTLKEFSQLPKQHLDKIGGYLFGTFELAGLKNIKLQIDATNPAEWLFKYSWS